jgi:hypothetical protein
MHHRLRRGKPKITHIRHSQGWINEVVEDINGGKEVG